MAGSGTPFAINRRKYWRCVVAVLAAWLLVLDRAQGQQPVEPGEVDAWHQNLVRERQVEVRLRTALKDLAAGQLVGGLAGLQSIIDRDDDVFVRFDSEPVPCGAHSLAIRLLGAQPAPVLAAYESLHGGQARQELEAACRGSNPDLLASVIRRFYHTAAGFEAGNRLAAYWTDHGCDELAWGWWQRMLAEPAHQKRVQTVHRVQAASCCQRLGRPQAAARFLASVAGDETITIAGRKLLFEGWQAQCSQSAGRGATDADMPVVCGRGDRNGAGAGSSPAQARPLWRTGLAGDESRHVEALARTWERLQLQNGLPVGTSQFPLLVGERLVFRDFEGLRVVNVRTGVPLWSYKCASSLSREIPQRQSTPADGKLDLNLMRHLVGHCMLGTLASDGTHVFAIDGIEAEEPATPSAAGSGDAPQLALPQSNLLLAFKLAAEGTKISPKWSAGGRESGADQRRTLPGHFFLGPPLPVENRLFVISECNQQLYLSCLKSATGILVWSQVLCSVPQPIGIDHQRLTLVSSPTYSDGVVVCPTHAGLLVAIDSLSGTLLWAASHDDGEPQQRQQISAWPYGARGWHGHPGYINLPVIHGSNVVYLAPHSEHVRCLDLVTGRTRWRVRRDDLETSTATEYLAAVTDDTVVIAGRRVCRGLELASGSPRWTVRLGSTPSGRGIRLGANYHVPLDDGRVVAINVDSGRCIAPPKAPGATRLGNLVAGSDLVVSMASSEIAVFPQAQSVLHGLESEMSGRSRDPAKVLELAELELTLGRIDRAEKNLEEVVHNARAGAAAVRAADLLRELLVGKLPREQPGEQSTEQFSKDRVEADAILERLAELSPGPEQRGRYLLERCRVSRDGGDIATALSAARELAALSLEAPLEISGDPSRTAAPHVLAAGLIKRLTGTTDPAIGEFETRAIAEIKEASAAPDIAPLRRLASMCGKTRPADEVRLKVAQLLVDQGRFQQAEMVLLSCRESGRTATAGQATRMLAELWNQQGLFHDAALFVSDLAARFAEVEIAPGRLGATWIAAIPRETPLFEAYRRLSPPAWSASGVTIVENRAPNETLQALYNANGIQSLPTPRQSPFDLLDKGLGAAGAFSIVDRHTGRKYPETINVPGRCFYPANPQSGYLQHSHVGHFFPLGGTGALYGISLLERKLLWTSVPKGLSGVKERVIAGPAGPGFCTFQYRQRLYVADPVDGRILWQRDDLEAASGLMSEPFLGIIGDEQVLVVFASNGSNYTAYETATGAELRRGKLDLQQRPRRAIGRRLFHHTAAADGRRLRVWDALEDRFVWDEPADGIAEASILEGAAPGTKIFSFIPGSNEAAFVTTAGCVRVVDLVSGQDKFEMPLEAKLLENLCSLRAFHDHDRYFFNLQRSWPPGKAPADSGQVMHDASIPCAHVEGELCALDVKTKRVLWQRSFGKRSFLQLVDLPLPVLVSLCRVRKQDQSSLSIEVLDIETGETLASRDELLYDRLLQAAYDRQAGLIELRGAKTTLRLEFPTNSARLNAGDTSR